MSIRDTIACYIDIERCRPNVIMHSCFYGDLIFVTKWHEVSMAISIQWFCSMTKSTTETEVQSSTDFMKTRASIGNRILDIPGWIAHNSDVISRAITSQITGVSIVCWTACHWILLGESTGDRWILLPKVRLRGKCFHFMTSWKGVFLHSNCISYRDSINS